MRHSYVLVLFDGLGRPPAGSSARPVRWPASRRAAVDASFPTTTTVSLATLATGLPPAGHGLLGYQLWLPEVDQVVTTIKWTTLWGEPIPFDYDGIPARDHLGAGRRRRDRTDRPAARQLRGLPAHPGAVPGSRFEGYHDWPTAAAAAPRWPSPPAAWSCSTSPTWISPPTSPASSRPCTPRRWRWPPRCGSDSASACPPGRSRSGSPTTATSTSPRSAGPRSQGRPPGPDVLRRRPGHVRARARAPRWPSGSRRRWIPRERDGGLVGPRPPAPGVRGAGARRGPGGRPRPRLLHRFSDDRLVGQHGGLTPEELEVPLLVAVPRRG